MKEKKINDFRETRLAWNKYYVTNDEALALVKIYKESSVERNTIKGVLIKKLEYLVYAKIKGYRNRFYYDDLLQEGRIGLVKAVDNFDPTQGVNFFKYARWHIQSRITRLTNWHKKNEIRKNIIKGKQIYDEIETSPESCFEIIEGEEILRKAVDTLPNVDRRVLVMRFGMYGSEAHTLRQIGEAFSLTKQRIEQIEKRAISKLRKNRQVKNFFCEL